MIAARRATFAVLLTVLAALGASPAEAKPDTLILISIDGFRADYLGRGQTPTLSGLAREGVAAAMRPSFPSLTFPNHYTLVTGLWPDHHGIVDNTMTDPVLGRFTMKASLDPRWWDGAEPLWVTADEQGLRTATMFWPGSDREIRGHRPDYYRTYDQSVPGDARVDQVLIWLDLPPAQRPTFLTLYFDTIDTAGHAYGPDSPQMNAALGSVDVSIKRLVDGLRARGGLDHTNIIIVADHGMASVSADRLVYLDDVAGADAIHMGWGPTVGVAIDPSAPAGAEAKLLALRDHARCWKKADVPPELHYGTNSRIPPIVCTADVGWLLTTHAMVAKRPMTEHGAHGYRPDAPEMAALFLAHGPAFRTGVRLKPFDNVDVQPLMAELLRLKVAKGDGSAVTFRAALSDIRD
ncbi:MAG TPA: ectonucleotide pyrophosphatase/phosphodiesterase [Caulobacteraceae bacterium]|jgi:predicted AlkP superfamily pyrophosphatase or phosphodiesterase